MKKFEEITTAAELLTYVKYHGRPTDIDSICRMQDIIGHTAVEDLVKITRENTAHMMPLLFDVWHWEEATRFYNKHVNKETREARKAFKETAADCITWKEAAETYKNEVEKQREAAEHNLKIWEEADAEADKQRRRADAAEAEVMKLKAMLFDYMMKAEA